MICIELSCSSPFRSFENDFKTKLKIDLVISKN
jgi:hypothetical protein